MNIFKYIKKHRGCAMCDNRKAKNYKVLKENIYPYFTLYKCNKCGYINDTWLNK